MKLSVVLPSYNEAENLKLLIPKIKETLDNEKGIDYEVLIIDSMNETDSTKAICEKYNIKYFNRENGDNYGDAIRTGISKAESEYLLIMDADGSHSPEYIPKMIYNCEKFDLTIGSRYINNGLTENPKILIFMSKIVNFCYRFLLKINVKDVSNSFRLYKTKDLKNLNLISNNFDIVEEILVLLTMHNDNYNIREIPITFKKRQYGESKRKLVKFIFSYSSTIIKLLKIERKAEKDVNKKNLIE